MNTSVRCAALVALCVGMAACAPRGTSVGYPSSYGAADPERYSRYDGSPYNYSDGSDPNFNNYRHSRSGANDGYYAAPPRTEYNPSYYRARGPRDDDPRERGWGDRYERSRVYPSRDF